jgi:hypothetical protein
MRSLLNLSPEQINNLSMFYPFLKSSDIIWDFFLSILLLCSIAKNNKSLSITFLLFLYLSSFIYFKAVETFIITLLVFLKFFLDNSSLTGYPSGKFTPELYLVDFTYILYLFYDDYRFIYLNYFYFISLKYFT